MKTLNFRKSAGIAALALAMSTGLAACGDDAASSASDSTDSTTQSSEETDSGMTEDSGMTDDIAAQTIGTACDAIPTDGAGSLKGMATEPVATAASANPLLGTLVTAVKQAELVDTLNSAEGITVFAPTDDAFAKIPKKDMEAVMADQKKLTTILTHHVVPEELSPEELAGTHETLAGDTVEVTGSGEDFQVGDEQAQVLCGNIPTANATVYVIDTVLMP